MLACILFQLLDVRWMSDCVHSPVYKERTQANAEPWESTAHHEAVRENGVLAPRLALRPWVSIHLRHVYSVHRSAVSAQGSHHQRKCQHDNFRCPSASFLYLQLARFGNVVMSPKNWTVAKLALLKCSVTCSSREESVAASARARTSSTGETSFGASCFR